MRYIASRTEYYRQYYLKTKDRYRMYYYEKKQRRLENDGMYEEYGGEEQYYKDALIKSGLLGITKSNE